MKLDFSKYHLKDKYRKVLENLSDEDKIRTAFKKNASNNILSDICEYYRHQIFFTGFMRFGFLESQERGCSCSKLFRGE